jgi:2-oxoglutarate ferredoxin oxidoreductase subunit gamma
MEAVPFYIPNFGVEQRGGVSVAFVQIGDESIGAPKFEIGDIVVALSDRAIYRTKHCVGPKTILLYNTSIDVPAEDLPKNARRVLAIPAVEFFGYHRERLTLQRNLKVRCAMGTVRASP